MRPIKIFTLIMLLSYSAWGQNVCGDFKDYKVSQNWINELKTFELEQRKTKILERIKCEQQSNPTDIDYWLTIIVDGIIVSTANEIPKERNKILELVSASDIDIVQSFCEVEGVNPQKCNLGSVIISGLSVPIVNENERLKNISLERKRTKVIIKLQSDIKAVVDLQISDFIESTNSEKTERIKVKKGKNRIVIPTNHELKLIVLNDSGLKTIILK